MRVKMNPLLQTLLTLASAAAFAISGWVALYYYQPEIPELLYYLLAEHPAATGCWLALSVVGLDYSLTATRDTIGYRNVGSKALAHWRLSGGGDK
jgi:hypothetical protein